MVHKLSHRPEGIHSARFDYGTRRPRPQCGILLIPTILRLDSIQSRWASFSHRDGPNCIAVGHASAAILDKAIAHDASIQHLAFSPDSKVFVTGSGNTARLWDSNTGESIGGGNAARQPCQLRRV